MTGDGSRRALIVTGGAKGMENQALGLAEAVGRAIALEIETLTVPKRGKVPRPSSAPDLWIGCGRAARRAARAHRKAFPSARFVYVQDPRGAYGRFDLIIAPDHDRLKRPNALAIIGAPHRVTPARLAEAQAAFAAKRSAFPTPRAAVLIGGPSKRRPFSSEDCAYLLARLRALRSEASLLLTVSRRTPAALVAALKAAFEDDPGVWLYGGEGENPYFAFLAAADWILVTEDSTNMLTEAAATGKPVYRLALSGKPGKFARLYGALEAHGALRPFLGRLERWSYPPLHETERAAAAILELLGERADITPQQETGSPAAPPRRSQTGGRP